MICDDSLKKRHAELERRGIYRRYWDCTFDQMEARGIPENVMESFVVAKIYADDLKVNVKNGTGLILGGPVGLMKTSIAIAVAQRALDIDIGVQFVTMASLLDNIFTMKAKDKEDWARYEERLKNVPILIMDDLGAEHTEGWVKTKLDAIISERYNQMLPNIITTNLTGVLLKTTYAERVLDRIKSTSIMLGFKGDSLRGRVQQ